MESTLVIKVQYGDTLRRFNARVDENDELDLDMLGLKAKIFSLFNFPPNADITMTYVDEDGDNVTLVDDDDLKDVMRQRLKFLKIKVVLNTEKSSKPYARSSGSSTPMMSPMSPRVQQPLPNVNDIVAEALKSVPNVNAVVAEALKSVPNVNAIVAEALKSVPEPLREGDSKIPLEALVSKAASFSPAIAELIESFAKMGPSFTNLASQSQDSTDFGQDTVSQGSFGTPSVPKEPDVSKDDVLQDACGSNPEPKGSSSGNTQAKRRGKAVLDLNVDVSVGASLQGDKRKGKVGKEPKEENTGDLTKRKVKVEKESMEEKNGAGVKSDTHVAASNGTQLGSSSPAAVTGNFSECPFSGLPVMGGATACPPQFGWFHPPKRNCNRPDTLGGIFHKGVRCDGCGVYPITGPRFKSKVKEDYDLCSICFDEMGNNADYDRIDRPIFYRPAKFFKKYEQHPWAASITFPSPPGMPPRMCQVKSLKQKLESRFISDVTVMDGTVMAPSTAFTKIWRMRNNGTVVWPRGVQLLWIGGDKFSNDLSVPLEVPVEGVAVDAELDIAVDFIAPSMPGRYISYWRMTAPSGQKFGQRVWVLIQVDASLKDAHGNNSQGLNLNLPPENHAPISSGAIDMNVQPGGADDFFGPSYANTEAQGEKPLVDEQCEKDQDINFPINDALLVGQGSSAPPMDFSPSVSYPIIDPRNAIPVVTSHAQPLPSAPDADQAGNAVLSGSVNKGGFSELTQGLSIPSPKASSSVSYPIIDQSETQGLPIPSPKAPSSVSYPIIDQSEPIPVPSYAKDFDSFVANLPVEAKIALPSSTPSPAVPGAASSGSTNMETESVENTDVEMTLLKELEAMGFKQVDLNKEILRSNGYNLEQSVDDLCGVSEWDPMLTELQEMGFLDQEMNKKLLKKNNGSIKRVVMDLLSGENA